MLVHRVSFCAEIEKMDGEEMVEDNENLSSVYGAEDSEATRSCLLYTSDAADD